MSAATATQLADATTAFASNERAPIRPARIVLYVFLTVTALIYFVVIYCASLVVHQIERRLAVSGETTVH